MQKNGRNSTTRRSRHGIIRHLFVKDRVTKEMLTTLHDVGACEFVFAISGRSESCVMISIDA